MDALVTQHLSDWTFSEAAELDDESDPKRYLESLMPRPMSVRASVLETLFGMSEDTVRKYVKKYRPLADVLFTERELNTIVPPEFQRKPRRG